MTETVTGYLTTKNSIYFTLLFCIGLTAPFWHVIYGIRDTEGLFGYKYMSSFLNSLGSRLCVFSLGLLILFLSKNINKEYEKITKLLAFATIYVGSYFLILIVFPKKTLLITFGIKDFSPVFYYLSMFLLCIISGYFFSGLQNIFLNTEEYLKTVIRKLFNFILVEVREKNLINDEHHEYYNKRGAELVKSVLDEKK